MKVFSNDPAFEEKLATLVSDEAERAVLGSFLRSPEEPRQLLDLVPGLSSEHFYNDSHQRIFTAFCSLIEKGSSIDLITLRDELGDDLPLVGGVTYIAGLMDDVPSARNVAHYAKIVQNKALSRKQFQIIYYLQEVEDPAEWVAKARAGIAELEEMEVKVYASRDTFVEPAPVYLAKEVVAKEYIIPEIIPKNVLVTLSGHPRSMKSLASLEIAIAAATGTPAFGMVRFTPGKKFKVWRIAQEDSHDEEILRARALLKSREILDYPENFSFSIHKGINLDDPEYQNLIFSEIKKHQFDLVSFDPIRNFSFLADKGPSDVKIITQFFRDIIVKTGTTICAVHHWTKEIIGKPDDRSRSQKISGGGWFAAAECPITFQKTGESKSLVIPEAFKFSHDPDPFVFEYVTTDDGFALTGEVTKEKDPKTIDLISKIIQYLMSNPGSNTGQIRIALKSSSEDNTSTLDILKCAGRLYWVQGKGQEKKWYVGKEPEKPSEIESNNSDNDDELF